MPTIKEKLLRLASESEKRGFDDISSKIASILRETRAHGLLLRLAAKSDQIEIDSWPDFLSWWNNNRGQNLSYIFVDTYGANSEQVKLVKRLVKDADKHEKDLHEFYMKLRDLASSNNLPGVEEPQAAPPSGGDENPPEPSGDDLPDLDMDKGDDDLEGLDI